MTSIQRTIKFEKKPQKGEKGASLRGPQAWSDMPDNYTFYQGKDGEEYKDVVLYNGNYYSCIKTHQKNSSNYPTSPTDTNYHYWKLADKFELVATNLFLANYALIKNLGVEAIEMKDSGGNVLFKVKDGNVTCKTGTFENITIGSGCVNYGVNRQPFFDAREASFSDSWLEPMLHDNIVYPLSIGRYSPAYLPWDEKANGRRIVIVNEYSDGAGYTITAPAEKYFYEDGIAKTVLNITNEAVFLVGYGNKYQSFSGWIVLSRVPLNRRCNQGTPRRVLYQGKCSNGGSLRYWTFDGSILTSSRLGQGHYRITFGNSFTSVDDYEVILSPYGMYGHETTQQVYASLGAKATSYFEVLMADDSSTNDANFLFEVIPATRWHR